ncbi:MAG: LPS export ABC transporter periplasmic protein LptC [Alphaproteobacteria bacterium]|nr:LPS export ABC transporter periplasmic protein LptC [Alphaproteobacteria bacterium]
MEEHKPADRLDLLVARRGARDVATFNPFYSRFVRWMRLLLPLVALAIVAVVFTWSESPREYLPPPGEKMPQQTVGKNELLNPRFESTDSEGQPFTVTAKRAVQGEKNEKLVILEEPVGGLELKDKHKVEIRAHEGAFEQESRRLVLRGEVRLTHDLGYDFVTPELHLDIGQGTAWSDKDVTGGGPDGTLAAKGLKGDNVKGVLVFLGPAKLTLNTEAFGKSGGCCNEDF